MASDSKEAGVIPLIHVERLIVEPEDTPELTAPVSVQVVYTPSHALTNAVWVLRLEVDMTNGEDTERHIIPLAAVYVGSVSGSEPSSCSLQSATWPRNGLAAAQADSTGALLRLSVYDMPLPSMRTEGQSEGKGDDIVIPTVELSALLAETSCHASLLDISCMVDFDKSEDGEQVRSILNPLG
jgi:hypothetical protein